MSDKEQEPLMVELKIDMSPERGVPDDKVPFSFVLISAKQASRERQDRLYKARAWASGKGEHGIAALLQFEETLEALKESKLK